MMVVQDIVHALQLSNVQVKCMRAEALTMKYDTLLGRAVANIPKFLSFSAHLLAKESKNGLYYFKGMCSNEICGGY
jgi:16S rRNA G527 N7-methylase RsmG